MRLAAALLAVGCAFGADPLFRQSVSAALDSQTFLGDYVLLDVGTGRTIAKWSGQQVVPVGSLLKPFVAVARKGPYPTLECDGKQCWKRHGKVGITEAIGYSCNSYFLQLLKDSTADELNPAMQAMGLPAFGPIASPNTFIGLDGEWRVAPEALLKAFAHLDGVKTGLELSARSGTMKAAGIPGLLGKTGTAPCTHVKREQGDGFALLWSPDWAVLVRVHNTTGANAAATAGKILRLVRGM